jgi:hypothetical protein
LTKRPAVWTGLAIYLDGSFKHCFRPDETRPTDLCALAMTGAPRQRRDGASDEFETEEKICAV